MKVGLSFDMEDLYAVGNNCLQSDSSIPPSKNFYHEVTTLLHFLKTQDVKCTLFFIGEMVHHIPELIQLAHESGHEIGIHGFRHEKIDATTIKDVEENLGQVVKVIQSITSKPVQGFRAPYFSVSSDQQVNLLRILNDLGFTYDASSLSSVYQQPFVVKTKQGLFNIPISNYRILNQSLILGGGYFRMLPYSIFKLLLRRCLSKSGVATVYFHNYEFFSQKSRISLFGCRWMMALRIWLIAKTSGPLIKNKFKRLLGDFDFVPFENLLPKDISSISRPVYTSRNDPGMSP